MTKIMTPKIYLIMTTLTLLANFAMIEGASSRGEKGRKITKVNKLQLEIETPDGQLLTRTMVNKSTAKGGTQILEDDLKIHNLHRNTRNPTSSHQHVRDIELDSQNEGSNEVKNEDNHLGRNVNGINSNDTTPASSGNSTNVTFPTQIDTNVTSPSTVPVNATNQPPIFNQTGWTDGTSTTEEIDPPCNNTKNGTISPMRNLEKNKNLRQGNSNDLPTKMPPTSQMDCISRVDLYKKSETLKKTILNADEKCPANLACQSWGSCSFLWRTGLITPEFSLDEELADQYFEELFSELEENLRLKIRKLMKNCYSYYGLAKIFEGPEKSSMTNEMDLQIRRKRDAIKKNFAGVSDCRARVQDFQECFLMGTLKATCKS